MDRGMQAMDHLPKHFMRVNRVFAGAEDQLRSEERRSRWRRR